MIKILELTDRWPCKRSYDEFKERSPEVKTDSLTPDEKKRVTQRLGHPFGSVYLMKVLVEQWMFFRDNIDFDPSRRIICRWNCKICVVFSLQETGFRGSDSVRHEVITPSPRGSS